MCDCAFLQGSFRLHHPPRQDPPWTGVSPSLHSSPCKFACSPVQVCTRRSPSLHNAPCKLALRRSQTCVSPTPSLRSGWVMGGWAFRGKRKRRSWYTSSSYTAKDNKNDMGKYTTDPLRTGREIEKADGLGTLGVVVHAGNDAYARPQRARSRSCEESAFCAQRLLRKTPALHLFSPTKIF